MRHVKRYRELFENESGLSGEQKEFLDKHVEDTWRVNPETDLVDVKGDFYCSDERLKDLFGIKFGVVDGDFYCRINTMHSLDGAPQEVGGFFYPNSRESFNWNTQGKVEYLTNNPELASLILPTIPHNSMIDAIQETPTLLKSIEDFDKVLYNKLLKDLGWNRMGPDLLRQVKNGIV